MFGKVVINEFIQRSRKTIGVCVVLLAMGLFTSLLRLAADGKTGGLNTLFQFSVVVFSIMICSSMFGFVIFQFTDFTKRCYKDEGYLTHTLPVSSANLIMGRMVVDVVSMLLIQISVVISVVVATGSFDMIKEVLEEFVDIIKEYAEYDLDKELKSVIFVGVVVAFTAELYSVWHLNVSYAVGHAFRSGRRILSIVACIVFYFIFSVTWTIVNEAMAKDVPSSYYGYYRVDDARTALKHTCFNLWILEIFIIICLVVYGLIVARCFKKHLNLE